MRLLHISGSLGLGLALVPALAGTAAAGSRTTVVFDQAKNKCTHATAATDGDKTLVEVSVVEGEAAAATAAKKDIPVLAADVTGKQLKAATIKAKSTKLDPPLDLACSTTATIRVGDKDSSCSFILTAPAPPAPPEKKPDPPKLGADADAAREAALAALTARARHYLEQQSIVGHAKSGGPTGRTYKLYHLPDGSPAFPLPNQIAEEDRVELWIVTVDGERPMAEIAACKDVPHARISARPGPAGGGTGHPTESGEDVKGAGVSPAPPPPPELGLWRTAPPQKCAEQLAYKLRTSHGEREVSLKIAPVHLFSWGLSYGFDFGRPTRLKIVERPVPGGAGETERSIEKEHDRTGFRPMVTLTLNMCRANLDDWDRCDWFGLTAMADPGRLTEGGGLGIKLQPYPGLGVLVGVTLFQSDTLELGKERDVTTLSIDKDFTWRSLGLFLGVGGDTDTVKKLF